jgi:hypothetical protein
MKPKTAQTDETERTHAGRTHGRIRDWTAEPFRAEWLQPPEILDKRDLARLAIWLEGNLPAMATTDARRARALPVSI